MNQELAIILCAVVAYLLGSFPTGYWVARAYGVNIQKIGSGNIGATNVLRSVGKIPALIVIIFDPLKGSLAVLLAKWLDIGIWGIALAALAVILGNNFNIFLRLKGGKGIATSLGAFLIIDPLTTCFALSIAIFTMFIGRIVSIGSLVGVFSGVLLHIKGDHHIATLLLTFAIFLLAMLRHKENLIKLAKGEERRLGGKSQKAS